MSAVSASFERWHGSVDSLLLCQYENSGIQMQLIEFRVNLQNAECIGKNRWHRQNGILLMGRCVCVQCAADADIIIIIIVQF